MLPFAEHAVFSNILGAMFRSTRAPHLQHHLTSLLFVVCCSLFVVVCVGVCCCLWLFVVGWMLAGWLFWLFWLFSLFCLFWLLCLLCCLCFLVFLFSCFLGCLVAWLLGCLVAWLLGCLVAWLLGGLVAWWLGGLVGSLVRWFVGSLFVVCCLLSVVCCLLFVGGLWCGVVWCFTLALTAQDDSGKWRLALASTWASSEIQLLLRMSVRSCTLARAESLHATLAQPPDALSVLRNLHRTSCSWIREIRQSILLVVCWPPLVRRISSTFRRHLCML